MVTAQIVVDTPHVTIAWDTDIKAAVLTWKGVFLSGPEFRSTLSKVLDLVAEKRANRMLADTRKMPVWSQEDQQWAQTDWMARSLEVGLRYSAVVMPASALAKFSLRRVLSGSSQVPRERALFKTVEEARKWLKAIPSNG